MQNNKFKLKIIGMIGLGILIITGAILYQQKTDELSLETDKVHIHSDFRLYVSDERIRFTEEKYQSSIEQILHQDFHLHDSDDEVLHRHADGITLAEFLGPLNVVLTNDCLILDDERNFCTSEQESLILYVNGVAVNDITNYITAEGDRILLYYGRIDNANLPAYLEGVTDMACVFSGTCPERGIPPPESCGLTCEI